MVVVDGNLAAVLVVTADGACLADKANGKAAKRCAGARLAVGTGGFGNAVGPVEIGVIAGHAVGLEALAVVAPFKGLLVPGATGLSP